ncbi:unnamed protein product [Closterium sp. Yama58-4]|nr:unnamed protein product [Closterium sp. Yama58-4]
MCARYEKALDSFLSTPTTANAATAATTPALEPAAACEPDLLFVFARKKQTPLESGASGEPRSRVTSQPPWLQWTLVAQLALPPLTLATAIHDAATTAATTAAQLTDHTGALSDAAGDTAGVLEEANTAREADSAAGTVDDAGRSTRETVFESFKKPADTAGRSTPDAPANPAEVWFSSQKMHEHVQRNFEAPQKSAVASDPAGVWLTSQKIDEHVQRWLMGRLPKRAWSDVAQCVAWYRPDLVFTRHPAFESHVLVSNLKQALGLPATATRAAVLAAYEAATWRQQASILRHVARLQLSADWDVLGLSAASTGGYIVAGDGDNRSGDKSDGDSNEDEWGEQDQTEEDEEDEGESGEEGEGEEKGEERNSEAEEGEEEDEDLVWSEAEEQRALARDEELMKQQERQEMTGQGLLSEGLTGGGDIDVLPFGSAAGASASAVVSEEDDKGLISDGGGDELSVMEQTLVRKKEEAAGEVKAAVGPFNSVRLIGELTLLYAFETGEETF